MHFLCLTHRCELIQKPEAELQSLWFEWMNTASLHYDLEQWRDAVSYAGCAFDLSVLYVKRCPAEAKIHAAKQLCLAAIYLSDSLKKVGQNGKADYALVIAKQTLEADQSKQSSEDFNECLSTVADRQKHQRFFHHHANLAFEAPKLPSMAIH